jgi:hypothetical protein
MDSSTMVSIFPKVLNFNLFFFSNFNQFFLKVEPPNKCKTIQGKCDSILMSSRCTVDDIGRKSQLP